MRSNNLHWPPMQTMIIKRVKAGLTQLIDGIEISEKEMERDTGIEPVSTAWEAATLPLC